MQARERAALTAVARGAAPADRYVRGGLTLYFLTADFLPSVRLSARGVWDVKAGRAIRPGRLRARGPG